MVLWFAGTAVATVWVVFHDPGFDYRLLVLGALLPDLLDAPFGGARAGHAIVAPVVLLVLVMLLTRGRRPLRRSLLALPIGWFLHLVFDGAFRDPRTFWWPVSGAGFADAALPSIARGWWNVLLELIGLGLLAWFWQRFGLGDPERRRLLWRTGHLDPAVA